MINSISSNNIINDKSGISDVINLLVFIIVIDVGYGGYDSGVIGLLGIEEKNIIL